MTKEELEKEAEKALDKRMGTYAYINRMNVQIPYTDGYMDSAEPREKRIAELIQEANKRYKACQEIDDKQNKEILDLKVKVKELAKGNAELKKRLIDIELLCYSDGSDGKVLSEIMKYFTKE